MRREAISESHSPPWPLMTSLIRAPSGAPRSSPKYGTGARVKLRGRAGRVAPRQTRRSCLHWLPPTRGAAPSSPDEGGNQTSSGAAAELHALAACSAVLSTSALTVGRSASAILSTSGSWRKSSAANAHARRAAASSPDEGGNPTSSGSQVRGRQSDVISMARELTRDCGGLRFAHGTPDGSRAHVEKAAVP